MLTLVKPKQVKMPAIISQCLDTYYLITAQMKIKDLMTMTKVDPLVQRKIIEPKVKELADYIELGVMNRLIYLPPIILSWRNQEIEKINYDTHSSIITIPESGELYISDGMHRIKALERIARRLETKSYGEFDENKYEALLRVEKEFLNSSLSVQIYLGLSLEQERNLFVDINNNGKRVALSKVIEFDKRDQMNVLTQEVVKESQALANVGVEMNKNTLVRPGNDQFTSLARVKKILAYLWTGHVRATSFTESKALHQNFNHYLNHSVTFFKNLIHVLPRNPGRADQYVTASASIQFAIALYLHPYFIQSQKGEAKEFKDKIEKLRKVDWSNKNTEWANLGGYFSEEMKYWIFKSNQVDIRRIAAYFENHL